METENSFIGPVNLGNPNDKRIIDVAREFILISKSKSEILTLDILKHSLTASIGKSLLCLSFENLVPSA